MKKHNIQAYLVPSTDPHQNEYLPDFWKRREWISGFTGSAGDLVVTLDKAGLWTDSRYFLQAEKELQGSGITLFKIGLPETPQIQEWLKDELHPGYRVGIDPQLISCKQAQELKEYLNSWEIDLEYIEINLIDEIWEDRPQFPEAPVKPYPLKYAGESIQEKLHKLRLKMASEKAHIHVITTLDAVAWLYNIRGADIQYNPVTIAYAVVGTDSAHLFIDPKKITPELESHLKNQVELHSYHDFKSFLINFHKPGQKVWLDPDITSQWIVSCLNSKSELLFRPSPIHLLKAIKNETEIKGIKSALVKDGIAMVKFLHWLENAVPNEKVTELSAATKLESFRREQPLYQGPSFETIAGYAAHGAIVHYAASPETDIQLKPEGIFLIDSGGQYLDGTTDITRTIALGNPTPEQKDRFSRVLKGHLQLAMTCFPQGTAGNQLDTIARKPLWDVGLNYGHGTGHGIGHYLNVHEGPQAISYYRGLGVKLEPGMILSNEPGYYKTGGYGIRIENIILTVKDEEKSTDEMTFYKFETLTLCPIDLNLVEKSLLSKEEIAYFNAYHAKVRQTLSPYLNESERKWLENATRPI